MNHRHPDADPNEVYPQSFKAEAEMEKRAFERDVIAALETAESVLFDAAQALRNYPGYETEVQSIDVEIGLIEDLRAALGGDS